MRQIILLLGLAIVAVAVRADGEVGPSDSVGRGGSDDVGPLVRRLVVADWIDADRWFATVGARTNQAVTGTQQPATPPVTTAEDAAGGCDGVKNGRCGFHTASGERFQLAHTRLIIERGHKLAARLQARVDAVRLAPLVDRLDALDQRLTALAQNAVTAENDRKTLYLDARRVVREIGFTNPLLNFDKILFVKRHDPGGLYHMVHQYYGFCQKSGGGLFVLHDPFSDHPKVTNLLANSVVARGRLTGQRLVPGTFLSPEVSFDGRTILFAYTQGRGDGIEWSPRASFHIFEVDSDGCNLVQLTDGKWNDFDPCYLPGGRIVFVSERRGGYLRCGRN